MKKIFLKTMLVSLIVNVIFITTSTNVFAENPTEFWTNIFNNGKEFVNLGKQESENTQGGNVEVIKDSEMKDIVSLLYNILLTLGIVVTIGVGGVLGIKFMLGSAEDKAKIKESLVPYIAGSIAIYGAFGIWKMCIIIFRDI